MEKQENLVLIIAVVIIALFLFGGVGFGMMGWGGGYGMMRNWDYGSGGYGFGMLISWIVNLALLVLIIVGIIWFVRQLQTPQRQVKRR